VGHPAPKNPVALPEKDIQGGALHDGHQRAPWWNRQGVPLHCPFPKATFLGHPGPSWRHRGTGPPSGRKGRPGCGQSPRDQTGTESKATQVSGETPWLTQDGPDLVFLGIRKPNSARVPTRDFPSRTVIQLSIDQEVCDALRCQNRPRLRPDD